MAGCITGVKGLFASPSFDSPVSSSEFAPAVAAHGLLAARQNSFYLPFCKSMAFGEIWKGLISSALRARRRLDQRGELAQSPQCFKHRLKVTTHPPGTHDKSSWVRSMYVKELYA